MPNFRFSLPPLQNTVYNCAGKLLQRLVEPVAQVLTIGRLTTDIVPWSGAQTLLSFEAGRCRLHFRRHNFFRRPKWEFGAAVAIPRFAMLCESFAEIAYAAPEQAFSPHFATHKNLVIG